MLRARDLRYRYDGRTVLDVAALELSAGSRTAVVGPNGSGKSTLLRLLAFLHRPHAGTLEFDGTPVTTASARRRARREVTLVEQRPLLFATTVAANIQYPLAIRRLDPADRARRVEESLDALGVAHLRDRHARGLSGGEAQRVAIARALAIRPRVLLLDEPLSAADRAAANLMAEALDRLRQDGTAVCFTSHQLEEAYRWADAVVALADGRVTDVTPENLFRAHLPPGDGPKTVRLGALDLTVVSDIEGPVTIAIPPDDIVVSPQPFESSARNQFAGTITRIADDYHGRITLTADVGIDLLVRVTPAAVADLGLQVGTPVILSVKAMAVRVF